MADDFYQILAELVPLPEKRVNRISIPDPDDSIHLSIQGGKAIKKPVANDGGFEETQKTRKSRDNQGNKMCISERGQELSRPVARLAAWETGLTPKKDSSA